MLAGNLGETLAAGKEWLRAHDPDYGALRRAARTALIMPAVFALGDKAIGNPVLATFAAFGSFAMLLLVDFTGSIKDRLFAQAVLGVACAVLICLGTLASHTAWLAAVAMALVAFAVLFAGVVSSVLASATTTLLLAFILPVSLPGPASSIPDRVAGWGLAAAASLLAISLLWPAPARNPVRAAVIAACRAMADRLRAEVAVRDEQRRGRRRTGSPRGGGAGGRRDPQDAARLPGHALSTDGAGHRRTRGDPPGGRAPLAEQPGSPLGPGPSSAAPNSVRSAR